MAKLALSVIMAIRNEEPVIERALTSCADLAAEIIVVHDGPCADRSLDICRQYTDRVYVLDYVGSCGPGQVFGLERASHNWVFLLDGDEFLSPELRQHLPDLIADTRYQGYDFLIPTWYRGRYYYAYHKRSLVDKRFFYFISMGTEYLQPMHRQVCIRTLEDRVEHKPKYDNLTLATFKRKWVPWTRLRGRILNQPFSTIPKYNCPARDWDPPMRYRLRYPLTLGVAGSFVIHIMRGLYTFLRTRRWIFLKSGFMMSLYNASLYYNVWKFRKRRYARVAHKLGVS